MQSLGQSNTLNRRDLPLKKTLDFQKCWTIRNIERIFDMDSVRTAAIGHKNRKNALAEGMERKVKPT
jgi:hypothetical protein